MRRGDIYLADFDPSSGAEAAGVRPAIVVSNEGANRGALSRGWGVINVIPLTTSIGRIRPFQVLIPAYESGLSADSKAQAEQIRAISVRRLDQRIGTVPPLLMNAVDAALRVQLVL